MRDSTVFDNDISMFIVHGFEVMSLMICGHLPVNYILFSA